MELIEIAGYTENEKEHIAKEHLIPKQMEENGIEKGKLTIQSAALKKIINNYTKESRSSKPGENHRTDMQKNCTSDHGRR